MIIYVSIYQLSMASAEMFSCRDDPDEIILSITN